MEGILDFSAKEPNPRTMIMVRVGLKASQGDFHVHRVCGVEVKLEARSILLFSSYI